MKTKDAFGLRPPAADYCYVAFDLRSCHCESAEGGRGNPPEADCFASLAMTPINWSATEHYAQDDSKRGEIFAF